jgi:hypothetical protein
LDEAKYWRKQHDLAIEGRCEAILQANRARPLDAEPAVEAAPARQQIELNATLNEDLTRKLDCLFIRTHNLDLEMDENKLYDAFLLDQPEAERLPILHSMYAACHGGATIPEKEAKNYDPNASESGSGRIAKKSFAACLRAMGGIFKRKGTKIVWRNIHQRRSPCFADRFRASQNP